MLLFQVNYDKISKFRHVGNHNCLVLTLVYMARDRLGDVPGDLQTNNRSRTSLAIQSVIVIVPLCLLLSTCSMLWEVCTSDMSYHRKYGLIR